MTDQVSTQQQDGTDFHREKAEMRLHLETEEEDETCSIDCNSELGEWSECSTILSSGTDGALIDLDDFDDDIRDEYGDHVGCSIDENDDREGQEIHGTCVRFAPRVFCKATISRYDMTYEEALQTWIFPDEKEAMLDKYANTVRRMKSGKKAKKNSSYRGLETFDQSDADEMREVIDACVYAVMDEQDRQWEKDIVDLDRFAKISRKFSKQSKQEASARGKSDAKEAKKAYRRMETSPSERCSMHSSSSYTVETTFVPARILRSRPLPILSTSKRSATQQKSVQV